MKKLLLLLALSCSFIVVSTAQREITGSVMDESGNPLVGASVQAKDTQVGIITDFNGKFKLNVPSGTNTLIVSYLGYAEQMVDITGTNEVMVSLVADGIALDDLVVVGYAEQEKRFSTQSVSTLGSDAIKDWPVLSPQQLLQGQAAGVQMVNSSGLLGANSTVRIRGAASITGGGEPLFVVDGVPLNDNNLSFAQGGGTGLNPLMNINPNDIESMTVLKDAAAVAIYGSRGSNGVILITTKKGRKGQRTQVNLDMFTGWSSPTNLEEMMNTTQFIDHVNTYQSAQGLAVTDFSDRAGDYFDWPNNVVRTGRQNSVNLSVRGGSDNTTFFVGGQYMTESGFTIGNDMENLSGRFNMEHQANNFITIGTNLSISRVNMDRIGAENNTFAPLTSSYLQLPFVLPRDENGAFVNTGFIQNVLAIEELNINDFDSRRITGNAYADFNLAKGLTFRTDWGIDNFGTSSKGRTVNLFTPGGSAFRSLFNDNKWVSTNTLNYNVTAGEKHNFNILAGYAYETSRLESIEVAGNGFASDGLPNVASASTPTTTSETGTEWALESQFLRANYRYDDKYLLEASLRRDGSSRFGANNRYGTFWAVSGGYIISEEDFMKDNGFIDFLKITASYGTSGNDRIGNFTSLALYSGGAAYDYAGLAGLGPIQVPNPNLTWEETTQLDLGISMVFYKNIFNLDINYYDKVTTGLLLAVPYPFTTGFASAQQNIGSVGNRGVDINFGANIINRRDVTWNIGFNIGFLRNEVLELPDDATVDADGNKFIQGSAAQRAVLGRSLNEFYMVRANGVNPTTGDFEWLDKDGNPTTTYSADDRTFVGSAIPRFTGGFNTTFRYKNFDVNLLFSFTVGNMVLIDGLRFTENIASPGFNKSTALLDRWEESGDEAFVPNLASPTARFFNQPSTLQLQNGSFLRLRNLNFGYSLPSRLFENQNVFKSARLYVLAQNLWLLRDPEFRGPDPEVSANGPANLVQGQSFFALPQPITVTVGINVGF